MLIYLLYTMIFFLIILYLMNMYNCENKCSFVHFSLWNFCNSKCFNFSQPCCSMTQQLAKLEMTPRKNRKMTKAQRHELQNTGAEVILATITKETLLQVIIIFISIYLFHTLQSLVVNLLNQDELNQHLFRMKINVNYFVRVRSNVEKGVQFYLQQQTLFMLESEGSRRFSFVNVIF